MTIDEQRPETADAAPTDTTPEDAATQTLPTFTEQIADQLGGVRGLIESGLPVLVFVVANILWRLQPAIVIAVGSAVLLAGWRLARRQPVRHAVNGLLGIGIGAIIAWKTGSAKNFYLPNILLGLGYGLAMLASVPARMPLVGWLWSVVAAKGSTQWRRDPRLVRLFSWLTVLWGLTYVGKNLILLLIWLATAKNDSGTALGVARLLLGYPVYALLLAVTFWSVLRVTRPAPVTEPAGG